MRCLTILYFCSHCSSICRPIIQELSLGLWSQGFIEIFKSNFNANSMICSALYLPQYGEKLHLHPLTTCSLSVKSRITTELSTPWANSKQLRSPNCGIQTAQLPHSQQQCLLRRKTSALNAVPPMTSWGVFAFISVAGAAGLWSAQSLSAHSSHEAQDSDQKSHCKA